jgi:hypothetical protein
MTDKTMDQPSFFVCYVGVQQLSSCIQKHRLNDLPFMIFTLLGPKSILVVKMSDGSPGRSQFGMCGGRAAAADTSTGGIPDIFVLCRSKPNANMTVDQLQLTRRIDKPILRSISSGRKMGAFLYRNTTKIFERLTSGFA